MNRRGSTELGQALTSIPSLIIVFLITLLIFFISFFMAESHESSYSLANDFSNKYIPFNGQAISIGEVIEKKCTNESLNVKQPLRDKFMKEFGENNYFALVSIIPGSVGWSYEIHSSFGAFENQASVSILDFESVFGTNAKSVERKMFCGSENMNLYVKSDVEDLQ